MLNAEHSILKEFTRQAGEGRRMDLFDVLGAPVITGGAWGTELQERGLPLGACADAWNVTRPSVIEEIAREYADAGSRIVLSNTFQANRISLARHGMEADVGRIN